MPPEPKKSENQDITQRSFGKYRLSSLKEVAPLTEAALL